MGTFGLVREAVRISDIPPLYVENDNNESFSRNQLSQKAGEVYVSVFDDPSIPTFAVKTLKKSQ